MDYYPMLLSPCYKDYLWGGNRLNKKYNKNSTLALTAESWELACHKDGQCIVANGDHQGKLLSEIIAVEPVFFLGARYHGGDFPILVKLIDANKDLSIQVHPSDFSAKAELGEQGKAEMWYILEAAPKAKLYYGFKERINRDVFLKSAEDGTICSYLNSVSVRRGDVFYILPGTIHALGAGIVVAEIQQNSNTTFRIYDYNRKDSNGNCRPLHLERAMEVINYEPIIPSEYRYNNSIRLKGLSLSQMFSCQYFSSYKAQVNTQAILNCDGSSFHHLLFIDGNGYLEHAGRKYAFRKGDSYFLPAILGSYKVLGNSTILISSLTK